MFYLFCIFDASLWAFNVIAHYKLNIIIIVHYYYYYIFAQFVKNGLQSYTDLCACGNLMRNTHVTVTGSKYGSKYLHV